MGRLGTSVYMPPILHCLYIAAALTSLAAGLEVIDTYAGGGTQNGLVNDVAATSANLPNVDGNYAVYNSNTGGIGLWIAVAGNHCVRYIDEGANIFTIAGTTNPGYSGDGGLATLAELNTPFGIAVNFSAASDSATVYFTEAGNNCIRRVNSSGYIHTVAGNGNIGFSGDDGPASSATLRYPDAVAAVYNPRTGGIVLWIADTGNHAVRRVDEAGIITTVAGGLGAAFGGDNGPAALAKLNTPAGIHALYNVTSGGTIVWVCDFYNYRVRVIDEAGHIRTIAGTGTSGVGGNGGTAINSQIGGVENVFAFQHPATKEVTIWISEFPQHCVRRISPNGIIETVAGLCGAGGSSGDGGSPTSARLSSPSDVSAVHDPSTDNLILFITDNGANKIRRVSHTLVSYTPTSSPTASRSPSVTPSHTATPSVSPTSSRTASGTATNTCTATPSASVSATRTTTSSATSSRTASATRTATPSISPSASQTPTTSTTPSITPTRTPSASPSRVPLTSFAPQSVISFIIAV
ncbi:MAG: hypothetical protein EOO65_01085 [Methanosarcinales archaeon]|nr:MAG: hypothetical protein EOO65_01085 [Methanosarcinales archaeon]